MASYASARKFTPNTNRRTMHSRCNAKADYDPKRDRGLAGHPIKNNDINAPAQVLPDESPICYGIRDHRIVYRNVLQSLHRTVVNRMASGRGTECTKRGRSLWLWWDRATPARPR